MVFFTMGLALFAGEHYEEVWARLTETLADWSCWEDESPGQGRPGRQPVGEWRVGTCTAPGSTSHPSVTNQ